jgi:hypothetical protein
MKKKYIIPTIEEHHVTWSSMIAASFKGGGKGSEDPIIGNADYSEDENRTKGDWDFDWYE